MSQSLKIDTSNALEVGTMKYLIMYENHEILFLKHEILTTKHEILSSNHIHYPYYTSVLYVYADYLPKEPILASESVFDVTKISSIKWFWLISTG